MKKIFLLTFIVVSFLSFNLSAQKKTYTSSFGRALNLGVGIGGYAGYYSYTGQPLPVLSLNYEFDVARNFTLAPFISFSTHSESYYWGNNNHDYRYYNYHETIIPIGVKATYYFDELLRARESWDFYGAGSLGFAIINTRWDSDYYGDKEYYNHGNPLFLDLHIGAEYHINSRIGIYLDLSTGVSSIGLAIH